MSKKHERKPVSHSIRKQLLLLIVACLAGAILMMSLINILFLGRFYTYNRTEKLMTAYEALNELTDSSEDFSLEIMKISAENNINVLIMNSDFSEGQSTSRNTKNEADRLFGYYTGLYGEDVQVLRKTDNYVLQITNESRIDTHYLEMWGQLTANDCWFLLRTPYESIQSVANMTNGFYITIGILILIIATVIVWYIGGRFTEPIVQLSNLSKRMANLDFDAKYKGTMNNEIGELGENFNLMSRQLEKTVSELKTANVELQRDVERRDKLDEERREFLNSVTHELKTPIALIQGYAEGLKDNVADDPDSRDFYCDVITDEAAKMNTMVRKLLTLNTLESGRDAVQFDRFDLTQLISGVIQGMQILIEEKGAKVSFDDSKPVYAWGDEFKIEEVVTNYLSNALNHLDYDMKIEVTMKEEDGIVRTSVFNTGNPIPEEDLDRVFEKFYKVDKARTRAYGGSGIGLSIVKAIMDGHKQKYGVKNYRNGVMFWFNLETK